jgi:hypothetical protein
MHLTTQQKIVSAVLGLAVTAFCVDRWVIGAPEGADAVAVGPVRTEPRAARRPGPRPAAPASVAQAAAAEATTGGVSTLTLRLEAVAQAQGLDLRNIRDAFVPPPAWVGTQRRAVVEDHPDAAREFTSRHRLTAVMKQSGGGVAIIEGKTVAVGKSIGGFRLVVVKDRSAVLRRGNQRVELRLPEDPNGLTGTSENLAGAE